LLLFQKIGGFWGQDKLYSLGIFNELVKVITTIRMTILVLVKMLDYAGKSPTRVVLLRCLRWVIAIKG